MVLMKRAKAVKKFLFLFYSMVCVVSAMHVSNAKTHLWKNTQRRYNPSTAVATTTTTPAKYRSSLLPLTWIQPKITWTINEIQYHIPLIHTSGKLDCGNCMTNGRVQRRKRWKEPTWHLNVLKIGHKVRPAQRTAGERQFDDITCVQCIYQCWFFSLKVIENSGSPVTLFDLKMYSKSSAFDLGNVRRVPKKRQAALSVGSPGKLLSQILKSAGD